MPPQMPGAGGSSWDDDAFQFDADEFTFNISEFLKQRQQPQRQPQPQPQPQQRAPTLEEFGLNLTPIPGTTAGRFAPSTAESSRLTGMTNPLDEYIGKPARRAFDKIIEPIKPTLGEISALNPETYAAIPGFLNQLGTDLDTLSKDLDNDEAKAAWGRLLNIVSSPTARAEATELWNKGDKRKAVGAASYALVPFFGESILKAGKHFEKGEYQKSLGTGIDIAANLAGLDVTEAVAAGTKAAVRGVAEKAATSAIPKLRTASEARAFAALDPKTELRGEARAAAKEAAPLIAQDKRFQVSGPLGVAKPAGALGVASLKKGAAAMADAVDEIRASGRPILESIDAAADIVPADGKALAQQMGNVGRREIGIQGEANIGPVRAATREAEGVAFDKAVETVKGLGDRGVKWSGIYNLMEDLYRGVKDPESATGTRAGNRLAADTVANFIIDNGPPELAAHVGELQYNRVISRAADRAAISGSKASVENLLKLARRPISNTLKLATLGQVDPNLTASQMLGKFANMLERGQLARAQAFIADAERAARRGGGGAPPRVGGARPLGEEVPPPPEVVTPQGRMTPDEMRAAAGEGQPTGVTRAPTLNEQLAALGATPDEIAEIMSAQSRDPNFQGGAGNAELAGSVPYPQAPSGGPGGPMPGEGPAIGPRGPGRPPQGPMFAPPDTGGGSLPPPPDAKTLLEQLRARKNPFAQAAAASGAARTPGSFQSAALPPPSPIERRLGPANPIPQAPPVIPSRTNAPMPEGAGNLGAMMQTGAVAPTPPVTPAVTPTALMPADMIQARINKYGEFGAARSLNMTVPQMREALAAGGGAAPPVRRVMDIPDNPETNRLVRMLMHEKGWTQEQARAEVARRVERASRNVRTGVEETVDERGVTVPATGATPAVRMRGENAVDATIETVRWRDAQVKKDRGNPEHAANVAQAIDDALNRGIRPEDYASLESLNAAIGRTPYKPQTPAEQREIRSPWLKTGPREMLGRQLSKEAAEAESAAFAARAAQQAPAELPRNPVPLREVPPPTGVTPETPIQAGAIRPVAARYLDTAIQKVDAAHAAGRLDDTERAAAMARLDRVNQQLEGMLGAEGGVSRENLGFLKESLDKVVADATGPRPNPQLSAAVDHLIGLYKKSEGGGTAISTAEEATRRQLLKDVMESPDLTPEMRARVEGAKPGIYTVMLSSRPGAGASVTYKGERYTPRFERGEDTAAHALSTKGAMKKGAKELRTNEIATALGIPKDAVPVYVDIVAAEVKRQIQQSGTPGRVDIHIDPRIGEALRAEFKGPMPRADMVEFIAGHPDIDLNTVSKADLAAALQQYYEPAGGMFKENVERAGRAERAAVSGKPVRGRDYAQMAQQVLDVAYIGTPRSQFGRGSRAAEIYNEARQRALEPEYNAAERLAAEREQLGRGVVASPELQTRPPLEPEVPEVTQPSIGTETPVGLGPQGRRDATAQAMVDQGLVPPGPEVGPPAGPPPTGGPSPLVAGPTPPMAVPSVVGRTPASRVTVTKGVGTTPAQDLALSTVRQMRAEGLHTREMTDLAIAQHVAEIQGKPVPKKNSDITIEQKRAIDGLKAFRDIYLGAQRNLRAATPKPAPVPGSKARPQIIPPTAERVRPSVINQVIGEIDPNTALGKFTRDHPVRIDPAWANLTDGELLGVVELARGGKIPEHGFKGRDVKAYDRPLINQLRDRAKAIARMEGVALRDVFDVNAVRSPWELAGVGERIPGAGMADVLDRLTVNTPDIEPPTAVAKPKPEVTKKARKKRGG